VLADVDMWRLGLLNNEGSWGFDDGINKILPSLENRNLTVALYTFPSKYDSLPRRNA